MIAVLTLSVLSTGATAQSTLDANWARAQELASLNAARSARESRQATIAAARSAAEASFANQTSGLDTQIQLSQPPAFAAEPYRAFGGAIELQETASRHLTATGPDRFDGLAATRRSDIWFRAAGHNDRVRLTTRGLLRRADGSPLPVTVRDRGILDAETYDVSFTRGWPLARAYTASGLEVSLTPHAGIGVGDEGGSAEAGATLRIGDDLDRLAPDGHQRFGDRARWYLYAAGSGRAVGYNFARTRDGDFARSGMSQDKGSFLGDASLGVAYRRGPLLGSFGVVYREIKAEGLRGGEGFDRDVSEGLVAFQLSIRPQW